MEYGRKIQLIPFPMFETGASLQYLALTYHLIYGAEAKGGHDFPKVLYDKLEVVDDMVGVACE